MSGLLIDWFDEHGPKVWDPYVKRWARSDSVVLPPSGDTPALPVFDVSNVAALLDGDHSRDSPVLDMQRRMLGCVSAGDEIEVSTVMRATYPNVRPPFTRMWVEYNAILEYVPTKRYVREAWSVRTLSPLPMNEHDLHPHLVDTVFVSADLLAFPKGYPGPFNVGSIGIGLDEVGELNRVEIHNHEGKTPSDRSAIAYATVWNAMEVLLLSLSMMNARNIVQSVERPMTPPKRGEKRQLPLREMRTLRLDGRYVERTAKRGDGTSGPTRRHRYRGHWKEYGMKPGQGLLFGKYKCRVYVPDGQRGAADLGVVDKRYVVVPWPKASA